MAELPREPPRKTHLSLETTEPMAFGYGFISGLLSAILGIAGFGAVLALRFPQYLTHAQLRPLYSLDYLRAIIHAASPISARPSRNPRTSIGATSSRPRVPRFLPRRYSASGTWAWTECSR